MKIRIQNTDQIVEMDGIPARVWEGATEEGIPVYCFITRIAVRADLDCSSFDKELQETPVAKASEVWPTRMIL